MRPSAISALFPAMFGTNPPGGKGPPKTPSGKAPTAPQPIFVKGVTREEIAEQFERAAQRRTRAQTPSTEQYPTGYMPGSGLPIVFRQLLGTPTSRHSEYMRPRPDVPTPTDIGVERRGQFANYETQAELRGLSPEALEQWRKRMPRDKEPPPLFQEYSELRQQHGLPPLSGQSKVRQTGVRKGESVMLREAPTGQVARESVLRAMANGDTLRSARLGLNPELFVTKLWTEYFKRNGLSPEDAATRAGEFLDVADRIVRGETVFSVPSEMDGLVTDLRDAVDNAHRRTFDLEDTTTRMMSGYGAFPEKIVLTTQWQDAQIDKILGLLEASTIVDFDPYLWKSTTASELESAYTPDEAKAILREWRGFGPRELRQRLAGAAEGSATVTPAEVDAIVAPLQQSTQAQKVRELATSGDEMWTNLLVNFHGEKFYDGQNVVALLGDDPVRDTVVAVRQKHQPNPDLPNFQPDPNNIEFYYLTRGYEGKDAPEVPQVSRIAYEQREPESVEVQDDNAPEGRRWVKPLVEPTERRIKHGPTDDSYNTLLARLRENPSYEVSVLKEAHPVIWGGMKAVPEILSGKLTQISDPYDVVPMSETFDVRGPIEPYDVTSPSSGPDVVPRTPFDVLFNPRSRIRTSFTPAPKTPTSGRLREIIEALNDQDMRNVFAPGRTSDEITRYMESKLPDNPGEAKEAARLIVATRGNNRRAWNLMELRTLRAMRGEIMQNLGIDIGDTDSLTQLHLDEKRRTEVLKYADAFVTAGAGFERETIQRGGF